MKYLILLALRIYKKYISSGKNCRYSPTCSVYMYLAVEKYGVIKGIYLGIRRLLRCHPWAKGGVDVLN